MARLNDIAVTGMGIIAPMGSCVADFWEGLCAGRCGIRPLTRLDPARYACKQAGEVPNPPPARADEPPSAGLAFRFVRAAVGEALAWNGTADLNEPTGLVLASNFGDIFPFESRLSARRRGLAPSPEAVPGTAFQSTADRIARLFNLRGPRTVLSLSCASGAAALAVAAAWIRAGRVERALAGGFEVLGDFWWSGLCALKAMTAEILRPFDRHRSGTVFGEGAAVLMLESMDAARRHGTEILARLSGAGLSNNAFHMTAPDKQAAGLGRAMAMALDDADCPPETVDHVNCHGTGTRYNDVTEVRAIKNLLGERARRIPLTANKSMTSHTMGAAGAMEAIASVMSLRTGIVPPTINLREQDPECDLDVTPHGAARHNLATVLTNSAGIGGCNAALVFRSA